MLKKASQAILPALKNGFDGKVDELAAEGRELAHSYADLSARMLQFAIRFRGLWEEAKKLDKAEKGVHQDYLRQKLSEVVQTTDRSVWSKWNTIGEQAKQLMKYSGSLPPQRECLYEIAIAASEQRPIDRWIATKALTSQSTVREVASLRRTKKRKPRQRTHLAAVTLSFNSYEDAAVALKELLLSKTDVRAKSHQAFGEALKSMLELKQYESIKAKLD